MCEQVKLCEDMCQDKLCENIIRTSCGASKWCDNKLCVDKLCDNKLCGGKLCVSKWCEDKLCVDKLCVGMSKLCVEADDGRRRAAGYRTKNKNPTQRCGEILRILIVLNSSSLARSPCIARGRWISVVGSC